MSTQERIYVDIHAMQNVPPSCVNRDDTGSPKTAIYGGVTRARVSSQSWKHAMRLHFKENLPLSLMGYRTKQIVGLIADCIMELAPETGRDSAEKAAIGVAQTAGIKMKDPEKGTDALFFMSYLQAKALAELALEHPEIAKGDKSKPSKQLVANALKSHPSIDIALFGRMVASDDDTANINFDASAQVAHAISTHRVSNEYDYFTAVDDLSPEDSTGAAHLGTVEFNSSTLYRYATIAVHDLNRQLGKDTVDTVKNFIQAFVTSMPTGKQNTFANRTLPYALMVCIREDQPVNLVGAFEKPVTSNGGYAEASAQKFVSHAETVWNDFAGKPAVTLVTGQTLSKLGEPMPFSKLVETLGKEIEKRLGGNGES